MKLIRTWAAIAVASALLTACGGGGSLRNAGEACGNKQRLLSGAVASWERHMGKRKLHAGACMPASRRWHAWRYDWIHGIPCHGLLHELRAWGWFAGALDALGIKQHSLAQQRLQAGSKVGVGVKGVKRVHVGGVIGVG